MSSADLGLWIGAGAGVVAAIAAVATLVYTAIPFHAARRTMSESNPVRFPRRPVFAIGLLVLLSWAAIGFDYYDRHLARIPISPIEHISFWGIIPPDNFIMSLDTNALIEYGSSYKAILIVRIPYADVDRMNDIAIGKSITYTIAGAPMSLAVPSPPINITFGTPLQVEFDLVILPSKYSVGQIKKLSDVIDLGGNIVATVGKIETFYRTSTNPPIATLPSPTPPASPAGK